MFLYLSRGKALPSKPSASKSTNTQPRRIGSTLQEFHPFLTKEVTTLPANQPSTLWQLKIQNVMPCELDQSLSRSSCKSAMEKPPCQHNTHMIQPRSSIVEFNQDTTHSNQIKTQNPYLLHKQPSLHTVSGSQLC